VQYSQLKHHCLGHVGHATLKTMIEMKILDGATTKTFNDSDLHETCSGCIVGKDHRKGLNHQQQSR
jgi:hypothetical protein